VLGAILKVVSLCSRAAGGLPWFPRLIIRWKAPGCSTRARRGMRASCPPSSAAQGDKADNAMLGCKNFSN
jgi:hypothetical protein